MPKFTRSSAISNQKAPPFYSKERTYLAKPTTNTDNTSDTLCTTHRSHQLSGHNDTANIADFTQQIETTSQNSSAQALFPLEQSPSRDLSSLDQSTSQVNETITSSQIKENNDYLQFFLESKLITSARLPDQSILYKNLCQYLLNFKGSVAHLESVLALLPSHIFDAVDSEGQTPLMYACRIQTPEVIDLLLKKYPQDINQQNNYGDTIFSLTLEFNNIASIAYLFTQYRDSIDILHQNNDKETILCLAAKNKDIQVIKYCLEIFLPTIDDEQLIRELILQLLSTAIDHNNTPIATYLVDHHIKPNYLNSTDIDGDVFLVTLYNKSAQGETKNKIIKYIIVKYKQSIDFNLQNYKKQTLLEAILNIDTNFFNYLLKKYGHHFNYHLESIWEEPLLEQISTNCKDPLSYIEYIVTNFKQHIDINLQNEQGETIFLRWTYNGNTSTNIITYLITHYRNEIDLTLLTSVGSLVIFEIILYFGFTIFQLLMNKFPQICHLIDQNNNTLLNTLLCNDLDNKATMQMLGAAVCNANAEKELAYLLKNYTPNELLMHHKNNKGKNFLMLLSECDIKTVDRIISYNSKIVNLFIMTLLKEEESINLIPYLVKHHSDQIDINAQDSDGNTLLMVALISNRITDFDCLIAANRDQYDFKIKNLAGETLLTLAEKNPSPSWLAHLNTRQEIKPEKERLSLKRTTSTRKESLTSEIIQNKSPKISSMMNTQNGFPTPNIPIDISIIT